LAILCHCERGGAGAGAESMTYTLTAEQLSAGYRGELGIDGRFKFTIENEIYYVTLVSLTTATAKVSITGKPQKATLAIGDLRRFELTGDNYYDISLKLNNINSTASKAEFTIKSIYEEMTEEAIKKEEEMEELAEEKPRIKGKIDYLSFIVIGLVVGVIIVLIILFSLYFRYSKIKKKKGKVVEKEKPEKEREVGKKKLEKRREEKKEKPEKRKEKKPKIQISKKPKLKPAKPAEKMPEIALPPSEEK